MNLKSEFSKVIELQGRANEAQQGAAGLAKLLIPQVLSHFNAFVISDINRALAATHPGNSLLPATSARYEPGTTEKPLGYEITTGALRTLRGVKHICVEGGSIILGYLDRYTKENVWISRIWPGFALSE